MALLLEAGLDLANWNQVELGAEEAGDIVAADTLLIVDMQNDMLPNKFAPCGGRAGIPEGETVAEPIVQLIEAFSRNGGLIVATRAFHPSDHVSFYEQGGSFPAHCVQSLPGSCFYPSIGEALHLAYCAPLLESGDNGLPLPPGRVEIAFKGFIEDVPSPSAFTYDQQHFEERVKHGRWNIESSLVSGVTCAAPWTGGMCLKCSNLTNDIDASPDLTALLRKDLRPLHEVVPRSGRLVIVGLALDAAVLDSAVAAARLGYERVFVVIDACRAAHMGMHRDFGSGFLTDPAYIVSELQKYNISVVQSNDVLKTARRENSPKSRPSSSKLSSPGSSKLSSPRSPSSSKLSSPRSPSGQKGGG